MAAKAAKLVAGERSVALPCLALHDPVASIEVRPSLSSRCFVQGLGLGGWACTGWLMLGRGLAWARLGFQSGVISFGLGEYKG